MKTDHVFAGTRRTSRSAAIVAKRSRPSIARRIEDALRAAGEAGHTDHELLAIIGEGESSVRPARRVLVMAGRVVDSGLERPSPRGVASIVWRIAGTEEESMP
jgi:hypothetical protein